MTSPEIEHALVEWWFAMLDVRNTAWSAYSGAYRTKMFQETMKAEDAARARLFEIIESEHGVKKEMAPWRPTQWPA